MGQEPDKELIWKYLDGNCDPGEKNYLENLLKNDPGFKQRFERLKTYREFLKNSEENQSGFIPESTPEGREFNPFLWAGVVILLVLLLLWIYSWIK
ncbi:MAG: hypothetical protein IPM34_07935 [Saprospiraceae bacterium]|nr:hypothetical protein [Saprospiraceae bacterium]